MLKPSITNTIDLTMDSMSVEVPEPVEKGINFLGSMYTVEKASHFLETMDLVPLSEEVMNELQEPRDSLNSVTEYLKEMHFEGDVGPDFSMMLPAVYYDHGKVEAIQVPDQDLVPLSQFSEPPTNLFVNTDLFGYSRLLDPAYLKCWKQFPIAMNPLKNVTEKTLRLDRVWNNVDKGGLFTDYDPKYRMVPEEAQDDSKKTSLEKEVAALEAKVKLIRKLKISCMNMMRTHAGALTFFPSFQASLQEQVKAIEEQDMKLQLEMVKMNAEIKFYETKQEKVEDVKERKRVQEEKRKLRAQIQSKVELLKILMEDPKIEYTDFEQERIRLNALINTMRNKGYKVYEHVWEDRQKFKSFSASLFRDGPKPPLAKKQRIL